jgi:hypothetical protein
MFELNDAQLQALDAEANQLRPWIHGTDRYIAS